MVDVALKFVTSGWIKKKDIAISKNGQLKMDGKKGAALIE